MSGLSSQPITSPQALAVIADRTDAFLVMLRDAGRVEGLPGLPLAEAAHARRSGLLFAWREFEGALSCLRDDGGVLVCWDCRSETLDSLADLVLIRRRLCALWPLPLPTLSPGGKAIAQTLPLDWPPAIPANLWEQARLNVSRLRAELAEVNRIDPAGIPQRNDIVGRFGRRHVNTTTETSGTPERNSAPNEEVTGELPTMPAAASTSLSEYTPDLHDPPEAIVRLSDASLRQRGLETWAAAGHLAALLAFWEVWTIRARKGERDMGYALNLENGAALCLRALRIHGATVAAVAEEALRGFPRVPRGPIRPETDAAFVEAVRDALPRLRLLADKVGEFMDLLALAPAAALSGQPAAESEEARTTPPIDKETHALACLLTIGPNATKIAEAVGIPRTTLLGWETFREKFNQMKADAAARKIGRRRGRRAGGRDFEEVDD